MFDADCRRCPRLVSYRQESRRKYADYHSAPVPAFGAPDPRLLIVGLAPGLHGANRTGRPFTGDFAGILLYESLHALGLSSQAQSLSRDDALTLRGVRITNAVKCVPPQNKPTPAEARECLGFLRSELELPGDARVVLALGRIAHDAVLAAFDLRRSSSLFAHGAEHALPNGHRLIDSYHCSRYNTQTRRLTTGMFQRVLGRAAALAGLVPPPS
ncbi:MAG TPA: uracil-DNA glycosylase [Steroidobacteraceae bacterium]|nr:uracil-DNA glycosylase [Steroidobacteraceae bacterium]HQW09119.1 uracil-DNA glycosylase [Steroidobacteraceae bacterium]HQX47987.1 uracil-DNA glycosylase [Steroidobacteraceae bacterium]HQX79531.1 uracil-DNA glycosylase [Steroidobacteraceae bacterium]HQZ79069.1 uracil-DNA glycosylase [Steroidobacteraceae bacterium]